MQLINDPRPDLDKFISRRAILEFDGEITYASSNFVMGIDI